MLIHPDKCNGGRECEIACAAKQSGTSKLSKRCGDGQLWHPQISLTQKPVSGIRIPSDKSVLGALK